ncbi:hypothetical protein ACIBTP_28955 [Streptomyces avidinii]|uniref:hypothetical protein n=1 Tax=Streptomyces avidinii TaxID=1895 RepID=UPI0037A307AF
MSCLTIEDPIEYLHQHKRAAVNQREVGTDTDPFPAALGPARGSRRPAPRRDARPGEHLRGPRHPAHQRHAQTLDRIVDVFPAEQQPQIRLQLAHTLVGIPNQTLTPRTGRGRVAAFEVLVGTSAIRNMVATGHREGMQTLGNSINALVAAGTIAYEEAVPHTAHPEDSGRSAGAVVGR